MGAYGSRQFREQLESLKSNDPRLYSLPLDQVPLGDEGVRVLARALHSNKVLRRLCVGHCNISPLGLQWLVSALCDGRSVPPKLRRLELVCCLSLQLSLNSGFVVCRARAPPLFLLATP